MLASTRISEGYRFGFNGQEKDNEIKGIGNSLDFGARIYDSRLGKWLSTDPLQKKFPFASPYNFVLNNPIELTDPDGKQPIDPRTGKQFTDFKMGASVVLTIVNNVRPTELDTRLLSWAGRYDKDPNGSSSGLTASGLRAQRRATSLISKPALLKLNSVLKGEIQSWSNPKSIGMPYASPQPSTWKKAAKSGSYSFIDNNYAEGGFFYNKRTSFNVVQVQNNVITDIIGMKRNSSNTDYRDRGDEFYVGSHTNIKTDVLSTGKDRNGTKFKKVLVTTTTTNFDREGNRTSVKVSTKRRTVYDKRRTQSSGKKTGKQGEYGSY